jgi:signal transduction histidine kinase
MEFPSPPAKRKQRTKGRPLDPIEPILEKADYSILPPAQGATAPLVPADRYAQKAGLRIAPMLFTARTAILSGIRVVDFKGTVVASTGTELGLSLRTRPDIRRALSGEQVSLVRERIPELPNPPLRSISRGARVRVFVTIPVTAGDRIIGAVTASRTPLDLMKALYYRRDLFLGAAGVLLAVVVIISVFTSLTVSRPVHALIRQTKRVASGEKSAESPIAHPVTLEIAQLSEAVAKMAVTLEKRTEYVKTFASNVSHGFKTPLTSIRGVAELLQDHLDTMPAENRNRFLANLLQDCDRLERLTNRLTDLAKAETARPSAESCDVREVIGGIVERYAGASASVGSRIDGDAPPVGIASETLDSILANLIENSIKYGAGAVEISVSSELEEIESQRFVQISVRDDGPGISQANIDKVFEPFFTTSGEQGGTGLGLSISRALLSAHGGIIRIDPVSLGAKLTVGLPVVSRASSDDDKSSGPLRITSR